MPTLTTAAPIIATANRLGQVKEYYFSRKLREIAELRAADHDVLNLGIGSPDLPPHPDVIAELHTASAQPDTHAYQGYQGIPELRAAFAQWYDTYFDVELAADAEVLPLIGSKEGIMHISMAYLNPGDEVLVPNPGYPTYTSATELAGGTVRTYNLTAANGWYPDLDELAQTDLTKVKIMWVNYPHMPTGTPANRSFYEDLVTFAQRHGILIVNDNPYAFILADEQHSILAIPGAKNVALELNSLSKCHNMAGWRVGMLAGAKRHLEPVIRFKSNMDSGMYKPVQLAAVKALQLPASWYEQLNDHYRARREVAAKLLEDLGCVIAPNQVGMFLWARIGESYPTGYALADAVLDNYRVFITPGGIFGPAGAPYVRISLCSSVEKLETARKRLNA
ncbi:MAG: aminotransferase class I/II-fold pyridoxal phosphate-dependent enzyme [Bacteroidota bacterium]